GASVTVTAAVPDSTSNGAVEPTARAIAENSQPPWVGGVKLPVGGPNAGEMIVQSVAPATRARNSYSAVTPAGQGAVAASAIASCGRNTEPSFGRSRLSAVHGATALLNVTPSRFDVNVVVVPWTRTRAEN